MSHVACLRRFVGRNSALVLERIGMYVAWEFQQRISTSDTSAIPEEEDLRSRFGKQAIPEMVPF